MGFKDVVEKADAAPRSVTVRTDYRCKAHGCPNAASMEGDVCYWHFRSDPLSWGSVTHSSRQDFESMRNHGPSVPFSAARRDALLKRIGSA